MLQGAITHNCQCDNMEVCGSLHCAQILTRFKLVRHFLSQVVSMCVRVCWSGTCSHTHTHTHTHTKTHGNVLCLQAAILCDLSEMNDQYCELVCRYVKQE